MKRLFRSSKATKDERESLDAIAVQEAEEEIRFDQEENAEQISDVPFTDSMLMNAMDLDFNAFSGEDGDEEEGALVESNLEKDNEDAPKTDDGTHIEIVHLDETHTRGDALPISVIPMDDANDFCQCETLESVMERLPDPLAEMEHYFSKLYVLSSLEQEHIRLLQTQLFGSDAPLAREKTWFAWKSKRNTASNDHASNRMLQQWKRLVSGPILWRSSGQVPWPMEHALCATCQRPMATALRPIWVRSSSRAVDTVVGGGGGEIMPLPASVVECELVLFTTGCLILRNEALENDTPQCKIYGMVLWSEVEFIEPSDSPSKGQTTIEEMALSPSSQEPAFWCIDISTLVQEKQNLDESERSQSTNANDTSPPITLLFESAARRDLCYRMLTAVFLRNLTYHRAQEQMLLAKNHPTPEIPAAEPLGWQYQHVYQPYFTLAVTNRLEGSALSTLTPDATTILKGDGINQLDTYNGMAPLHYAIYYNHVPAIMALLQMGADPNCSDERNHYTPLDYCSLHQSSISTRELLQQYGATETAIRVQKRSTDHGKDMVTLQGELFGRVAGTEQLIQERREHREKIENIMQEQRNNIQLLQQRGEQIDTLSAGAANLNAQAQDYASMAKQLKQKMKQKQQKQWLPF